MKRLIFPAIFFVSLVTFACQPQVQSAQSWVDKPVTTQPGAPTNGQVVQTITDTAAPFLPAPWGYVVSGVVTGGLLLLKHLADNKQSNNVQGKLTTVAGALNDVAVILDSVHQKVQTPDKKPSPEVIVETTQEVKK
jgi:hypothetical protein